MTLKIDYRFKKIINGIFNSKLILHYSLRKHNNSILDEEKRKSMSITKADIRKLQTLQHSVLGLRQQLPYTNSFQGIKAA